MPISMKSGKTKARNKRRKPVYLREIQILYKKRRVKEDSSIRRPIQGAKQIVEIFSELQNEAKEKLITVSLDAKLRILCFEVVAVGSVNSIYLRPIEMIRAAIPLNPYGIIIIHNHPSGDPTPSDEDKDFTSRLLSSTKSLGIELHDHIIIGEGSYFSFAEKNLLRKS